MRKLNYNVYGGEEAMRVVPGESEKDRRLRLRNAEIKKQSLPSHGNTDNINGNSQYNINDLPNQTPQMYTPTKRFDVPPLPKAMPPRKEGLSNLFSGEPPSSNQFVSISEGPIQVGEPSLLNHQINSINNIHEEHFRDSRSIKLPNNITGSVNDIESYKLAAKQKKLAEQQKYREILEKQLHEKQQQKQQIPNEPVMRAPIVNSLPDPKQVKLQKQLEYRKSLDEQINFKQKQNIQTSDANPIHIQNPSKSPTPIINNNMNEGPDISYNKNIYNPIGNCSDQNHLNNHNIKPSEYYSQEKNNYNSQIDQVIFRDDQSSHNLPLPSNNHSVVNISTPYSHNNFDQYAQKYVDTPLIDNSFNYARNNSVQESYLFHQHRQSSKVPYRNFADHELSNQDLLTHLQEKKSYDFTPDQLNYIDKMVEDKFIDEKSNLQNQNVSIIDSGNNQKNISPHINQVDSNTPQSSSNVRFRHDRLTSEQQEEIKKKQILQQQQKEILELQIKEKQLKIQREKQKKLEEDLISEAKYNNQPLPQINRKTDRNGQNHVAKHLQSSFDVTPPQISVNGNDDIFSNMKRDANMVNINNDSNSVSLNNMNPANTNNTNSISYHNSYMNSEDNSISYSNKNRSKDSVVQTMDSNGMRTDIRQNPNSSIPRRINGTDSHMVPEVPNHIPVDEYQQDSLTIGGINYISDQLRKQNEKILEQNILMENMRNEYKKEKEEWKSLISMIKNDKNGSNFHIDSHSQSNISNDLSTSQVANSNCNNVCNGNTNVAYLDGVPTYQHSNNYDINLSKLSNDGHINNIKSNQNLDYYDYSLKFMSPISPNDSQSPQSASSSSSRIPVPPPKDLPLSPACPSNLFTGCNSQLNEVSLDSSQSWEIISTEDDLRNSNIRSIDSKPKPKANSNLFTTGTLKTMGRTVEPSLAGESILYYMDETTKEITKPLEPDGLRQISHLTPVTENFDSDFEDS